MKPSISQVFAVAALLLLGACGTPVISSVSRFHTLPVPGRPQTFTFYPSKAQEGSLEYESYCSKVAECLNVYGWHRVDKPEAQADFVVAMTYQIDEGTIVSGVMPLFGQTGGGTAQTYGTVTSGVGTTATYSGTTTTPSTYGVIGGVPYSRHEFGRVLILTIIDKRQPASAGLVKVFEGRVLSSGSSGEISAVLPTMIDALFRKFPGTSGKVETVGLRAK